MAEHRCRVSAGPLADRRNVTFALVGVGRDEVVDPWRIQRMPQIDVVGFFSLPSVSLQLLDE